MRDNMRGTRKRYCNLAAVVVLLVTGFLLYYSTPRAAAHMKQLPKRQWSWGIHNSYLRRYPTLVEQHRRGIRLFEIDTYWWLGSTWLVAHVPVLGISSHVGTLEGAVCTLRQIGDGDTTLMLDVKNIAWPSCGAGAVQELRRQLGACRHDGPLRVLIDVSCQTYSNVQCARSLRGTLLANTTLLYRGIDFWWLSAGRGGQVSHGSTCDEFTEPKSWITPARPVLLECSAPMALCVEAAVQQSATWLQTTSTGT